MANSVDPDQTASSEAVWSWSALFAETYLSQYIEFVRYFQIYVIGQSKVAATAVTLKCKKHENGSCQQPLNEFGPILYQNDPCMKHFNFF